MWLCIFVWNKACIQLQEQQESGNRTQATDADNRVAPGVLNFAHTNIGITISLLSAPVMIKSVLRSCKPCRGPWTNQ